MGTASLPGVCLEMALTLWSSFLQFGVLYVRQQSLSQILRTSFHLEESIEQPCLAFFLCVLTLFFFF